MLGLKVSLCQLCFAVACDCGLTYFRVKMMSTHSTVCLSIEYVSLIVPGAFVRRCE